MATIFKVVYLLLTFLSFNCFTAKTEVMPYLSIAVTCLGALFIIYRIIHIGRYIKTKYIFLLILFLFSGAISVVVNYKYGFIEGVQGLIWMTFQYFILYATDYSVSPEKHKRSITTFAVVTIAYTTLANIVSFIMLIMKFDYRRSLGNTGWVFGGLHWGRLWGMYTDPNFGAVISCVAIVLALLLVKRLIKHKFKIILYLTMFIQLTYIAFSDSRTGLVCIISIAFCLCFFFLPKKIKENRKIMVKGIISVFVFVCITVSILVYQKGIVHIYNKVASSLSSSSISPENSENDQGKIQRTDQTVTMNNISNGRFDIWERGFKIFLSKPLTGVSFRNIKAYVNTNFPELYILDGRQREFYSMHNDVFDIAVGQGLIGLVIFMTFVISFGVFILKRIFKIKSKEEYSYTVFLFTAVITIIAGSFFISSVVYVNNPLAVLFWTILGELIYNLHRSYAIQETSDSQIGIITEHRARNYGSCLQAIALKHVTEEWGYKTQIVDYRPGFIEDSFGIFIKELYRQARGNIKETAVFLIKTIIRIPLSMCREIKFYKFREQNMNLTFDSFKDGEEYRIKELRHSCYLLGSDQIWNPVITKGICSFYFGQGLNDHSKKASYAASIGIKKLDGYEDKFKEVLKNIHYISVREDEAKELIEPFIDKKIDVVLDPTFIADRNFWLNCTGKDKIKEKYILVYALEINDDLIQAASNLSQEKKIPLVFFDLKNRYGVKAISKYSAEPFEFLTLLQNANYIITNSFHGTVFSIIYQKQFLCVPHGTTPGRMLNLLEKLDLTERVSYNNKDVMLIDKEIDFKKVFKIIDKLKEESLKYLETVLRESCNEQV